ncbi:carboxypeptidase s1 [Neofusicoccum parvum]|uniref:Carboxypeptidase s1 n=1 Tax=Neofusicoccum parvum TaxID=310453 RepID=A0ACB5SBM0_9PEZI|nr:carboxypeptidase s1 [Neofusicoccum parvum]
MKPLTILNFLPVLSFCFPAAARVVRPRQTPGAAQNVTTITSPSGVTIRYKEPGKEGICETTPGVNSYSGYIDVAPDVHVFFYFFESKRDPANDPVTLWLNGGPGSDSLIGLFEEIGPCEVVENMTTVLRDYAWSEISNLLFLSQPVGTGFSYSEEEVGYLDPTYLIVDNTGGPDEREGRWAVIDPTKEDNSPLAAMTAWELVQGFYSALPQLNSEIESTDFHLWAESFGGHWGPAFFTYFHDQNEKIDQNTSTGRKLNMKSLGIVNGIVDEPTQTEYLLRFTHENTYGVKLINDTIYDHGDWALRRPGGCQEKLDYCAYLDRESLTRRVSCSAAQFICQADVEGLYYTFKVEDRGTYDIRYRDGEDVPPDFWRAYLNTAPIQNALGVDLNYTSSNLIYNAFSLSGDFAAPYLPDLEKLLEWDVQVSLVYGDADYICNWLGGEALSLAANWTGAEEFSTAGYTNLMVDGQAYGETRQYGKLSFTRVWNAGHEVPFFQPAAAFQIFNRTSYGFDIATGEIPVSPNSTYATNGTEKTTHTTTLPPLPSQT